MVSDRIPHFHLVYASQKGTAQSIADEIKQQCDGKGIECNMMCISTLESVNQLESINCLVFVGATTGDGDPPDTAHKFTRQLKRSIKSKLVFNNLAYTILGLGDTNYTNFCNYGKTLDKYLSDLGAVRFYDCGWADDGTGLEVVVEPWIEGLFPVLEHFLHCFKIEGKLIEKFVKISEIKDCSKNSSENNSMLVTTQRMASTDLHTELEKIIEPDALISREDLYVHQLRQCKFENGMKLTLPARTPEFLSVSLEEGLCEQIPNVCHPLSASDVVSCEMLSSKKLSALDAVKETIEISISLPQTLATKHEPGDSFGIVAPNPSVEVQMLLTCLGLIEKQHFRCSLSVLAGTKKRNAAVPSHLHTNLSLAQLLSNCIDIRAVPKKPLLRALVDYADNSDEKRRLMELVSKEGAQDYLKLVRTNGAGLLDLLILFPSLRPPLSVVLEHCSKLLPRPYSVASSSLRHPTLVKFAYNTIFITRTDALAYDRMGICTGYLHGVGKSIEHSDDLLEDQLERLSIKPKPQLGLYLRSNQSFRLPSNVSIPVIMIGPGTGVAPFVGFLEHREMQRKSQPDQVFGSTYLFFGCRNKAKDYLYETTLQSFVENDTLTKLVTCFSRDNSSTPKYVQDNLLLYSAEIADLVCHKNAVVYVCGDAKNMALDVFGAFSKIIQQSLDYDETEARKYLAQLQIDRRYVQDVWA